MEWGHRVLGRIIGIGFVAPLAYFVLRKRLTATLPKNLFGMALLLGAQGALGWYMVKSGLEDSLMETPGAVPRVSQYRLAAHLGTAFVLYAGMFGTGLAALMDWRYAHRGTWSGFKADGARFAEVLANPNVRRFARNAKGLTALVFLTALSGACRRDSRLWPGLTGLQAHLLLVWTQAFSTTSSLSWAAVWRPLRMSFSTLHTRRMWTNRTFGGAASSKIRLLSSLTTVVWFVACEPSRIDAGLTELHRLSQRTSQRLLCTRRPSIPSCAQHCPL